MKKHFLLIFTVLFLSINSYTNAQDKVVDEIIATVGNQVILLSDVENQYVQYAAQGLTNENLKCIIIEDLLLQKLLLNQSKVDSLEVNESQVDAELDKRIRYFVKQMGSQEKLEKFYNKSIYELKAEFREIIRDILLTQQMENSITSNIKITPAEVRTFFKTIPKDSIPTIETEIELQQIYLNPPVSESENLSAKSKITSLRERIIGGEDFASLAVLYSEDYESAKKGGELGFYGRGELVPEFEAVAFTLKGKEISQVIETIHGFHVLQLIERRGDQINVRHILITPKVSQLDLMKAKYKLDTIYNMAKMDTVSFETLALRFSDDPAKTNGGYVINKATGNSKFAVEDLDPSLSFMIEKMKVGEITKPMPMKTEEEKQAYRIIKLSKRTEAHKADLKTDYNYIQNIALQDKQKRTMNEWISLKKQGTYINISEKYQSCQFKYNWKN